MKDHTLWIEEKTKEKLERGFPWKRWPLQEGYKTVRILTFLIGHFDYEAPRTAISPLTWHFHTKVDRQVLSVIWLSAAYCPSGFLEAVRGCEDQPSPASSSPSAVALPWMSIRLAIRHRTESAGSRRSQRRGGLFHFRWRGYLAESEGLRCTRLRKKPNLASDRVKRGRSW